MIHQIRPAVGEPRAALVLLHGRGSDDGDLRPLLDVIDPRRELLGLTPRGPLELPPGGFHWYAVERVGFPDPASFERTLAELSAWLDELELPVILGGFSQGAVMSYAAGLGAGRPSPRALIALSGFIPTVPRWQLEDRPGLPVFVTHGSADAVIPVEFGRAAQQRLSAGGFDVTWREAPGGHHVDPRLLPELADWVRSVL